MCDELCIHYISLVLYREEVYDAKNGYWTLMRDSESGMVWDWNVTPEMEALYAPYIPPVS